MAQSKLDNLRVWRETRRKERVQYQWAQRNAPGLIEEAMQALGCRSQRELAALLKVRPVVVNRVARGRTPPGPALLESLCDLIARPNAKNSHIDSDGLLE